MFGTIGAVTDNEGFTMARRTVRPTPRAAQLGDFMKVATKNRFNVIRNEEPVENRSQPAHSRPTVGSQPAGSQPDISIRIKPAKNVKKVIVQAKEDKKVIDQLGSLDDPEAQ